jgi:putative selenate reductase molybdopterin-binding subunit
VIHPVGEEDCVRQGKIASGWDLKFKNPGWHQVEGKPYLKRRIGIALVMQGIAIPYLDMGGASIKMSEVGYAVYEEMKYDKNG